MAKLPSVTSNIPPDQRAFNNRVREALDSNGPDRFLTANDLISGGIAVSGPGGKVVSPDTGGGTVTTPATPKNVAAEGAIQNIIVTWDSPLYFGHAYAEIWGSSTDNLGEAVQVGMAPGAIFVDSVGPSIIRYYWVRFVNILGAAGAFNAVEGVRGETGPDVAYLLETLSGQITESELYNDLNGRIDEIDGGPGGTTGLLSKYTVKVDLAGHVAGYGIAATDNNGTPTSSFGVRADQFWVAPPSTVRATAPTTNLYVGYVWIDSSVTPNITKYYNGTTWQTTQVKGAIPFVVQAAPATVNGVAVPAGVYIDAAYIKNGTITNAKIGNAAIDNAKIADASISSAKIGDAQITSALIAETIQSNNYTASTGWQINKTGTATFNEVALRGAINGGAFTGYSWPASGTGFHLGPQGLLLGNFNTGRYFQVGANGDISAPKFSIVNGNATFSGNVTAGTVGGSNVGTTFFRSANFSAGSAGWQIESTGNAEFNQLTVRSGQVTGALLKAIKINSYSGIYVYIINGTPISSTQGPYYLNGSGPPQYIVGYYTMPAPETASHKIAAVINVQAIGGSASKDLGVLLVANASISGNTVSGEQIAYNVNSGPFGIATNGSGITTGLYSTATTFAVFVNGNNADYTVQTIDGLLFGVR